MSENPGKPQKSGKGKQGKSKSNRSKRKGKRGFRPTQMSMAQSAKGSSWIREKRIGNGEKLIVEGQDLVMPTAETLQQKTTDPAIFLSVLANPIYWRGTRIAQMAQAYQLYRPLRFEVCYVPQVPVTYSGNVIYGTLFDDGRSTDSLQQALVSSNGGGVCPCYERARSVVRLSKPYLPQQAFQIQGNVSEERVCPFRWVATYSGSNATGESTSAPGWITVSWKFEFSNGTGTGDSAVITTYQTPEGQKAQLLERLERYGLRTDRLGLPLYGTVIGLLKTVGFQLLRNIAVLILENTPATSSSEQTSFGAGVVLPVVPPKRGVASDDAFTEVHDPAGNVWSVSDDTPVVIYQQGPTIIDVFSPVTVSRVGIVAFAVEYHNTEGQASSIPVPYDRDGNWQWKDDANGQIINVALQQQAHGGSVIQVSATLLTGIGQEPTQVWLRATTERGDTFTAAELAFKIDAAGRVNAIMTRIDFAVCDFSGLWFDAAIYTQV